MNNETAVNEPEKRTNASIFDPVRKLTDVERLVLRLAYLKFIRNHHLTMPSEFNKTEDIGGSEEDFVTHKIELLKNADRFRAAAETLKELGLMRDVAKSEYLHGDIGDLTEEGKKYALANRSYPVPEGWCFCTYCSYTCGVCGDAITPGDPKANWDGHNPRKWECASCYSIRFRAEVAEREKAFAEAERENKKEN